MMSLDELTTFLGWCTVINLGFYLFSVLFVIVFKNFTMKLHSKIVGVEVTELPTLYFKFLGHFKLGIILLNLTPYLALKLMV